MKVLISGSTGLIGSALADDLRGDGHETAALVRRASAAEAGKVDVRWDPAAGTIDTDALAGFDAVIHLAGEPISGRWSQGKKDRIVSSRVGGTRCLCNALAALPPASRPGVLVSTSAVGYYGDRGDKKLDESTASGELFLSDVCKQWEAATAPAAEAGIRVAIARLGVVISRRAAAFRAMQRPFRFGMGGPVGGGRQYVSWIALADAVAAYRRLIDDESLAGPVNVGAPNPVTNAEFARALGRAMHRPSFMPTPAFVVRLALGEMADNLVLPSTRMTPKRLLDAGFEFRHPELSEVLKAELQ